MKRYRFQDGDAKLIYEKPKATRNLGGLYASMVIGGVLLEVLFFYGKAPDQFWKITAVDVVNVIAQLATTGVFFLAIYQYRRMAQIERQKSLVAECKQVVVRIIAELKALDVGNKTNAYNLNQVLIRLGNLGSDFHILFNALSEDIDKAIVRMHWQSMYLNEFRHTFSELEIHPLMSNPNRNNAMFRSVFGEAKSTAESIGVYDFKRKYFIFKHVLIKLGVERFEALSLIDVATLVSFNHSFFDRDSTSDYLYGVMNILDIQAAAPLIAAIEEARQAWRSAAYS